MPQEESEKPAESSHPRRRRRVWETLRLVTIESGRAVALNRHMDTAAVLSYYAFLSLVPLLLLLIVIASRYLVETPRLLDGLQGVSYDIFPGFGEQLVVEIRRLSDQRIWSVLSVGLLFWAITPLAAALRGAFTRVFHPRRATGFLKGKARDLLGALTLIGLFLLLVVGRIVYDAVAARMSAELFAKVRWLNFGGNFLMAVAGMSFFYLVFVPVRLRAVEILGGAVTAAALLFVLRPAFSWFIGFNPHYGFAFGSLKAVFLLFTWVYLSFVVILLGAEIMAAANRRDILLLRPLLGGAAPPHRARGALVEPFVRRFSAGEMVFEEGAAGHEMYYVRHGAVELTHAGIPLRVLAAGDYFGEMSMLIETPRTAAARATEDDTELIAIGRENFDTILRETPGIALDILREMAQRLKTTNDHMPVPTAARAAD
jgi:membrane protein